MSKYWLNIFFLFWLLPANISSQDCGCLDCPSDIPDNDVIELTFKVNQANNNDLSNADQGVCEVFIQFKHLYVGDLTMDLVSPAGQTIRLLGPPGQSTPTLLGSFSLSFIPCSETAMPDPGMPSVWDNEEVTQFGVYKGSYYPHQGCLENFSTGTVVGEWKLIVEDHEPIDKGEVLQFEIIFCDPSGIDCCRANAGSLEGELNACLGSESLLLDLDPSFSGFVPHPNFYDYCYLVVQNELILSVEKDLDLRAYPKGNYEICGMSYDLIEIPSIPPGLININDLRAILNSDDPPYCAEISEICYAVNISEAPKTTSEEAFLCPGDSIAFGDSFLFESGFYSATINANSGCDSLIELTIIDVDPDTSYTEESSCDLDLIGMDTVFLSNQFGCDSLIVTNTILAAADTNYVTANSCDPILMNVIDTSVFQTDLCDSVVLTSYNIFTPDTTRIDTFTCDVTQAGHWH